MVAFGSDWFVTSGNPMLGIETAITRRDPLSNDGPAFHDQERIRLHEAIAAYTINGAYVNFLDDKLGSIETGKLADLIVIDRNLFNIPPQEISEAQVLLTLLDGQPVYGNWKLESQPKLLPRIFGETITACTSSKRVISPPAGPSRDSTRNSSDFEFSTKECCLTLVRERK